MFDDPKKNLRQLEEALRAVECEQPEPQEEKDDLYEAPDPRNRAVDFHRMAFDDEETDKDAAIYLDKPRKSTAALVFLALLELVGLAAVALWWFKWLK